jgi:putative flippase GtrA
MLRLALASALGVGMLFWPYASRCGPGLAAYLGATAAVVVAGGWSARWTWRHRTARAHVLSLLLVLWGLVLAALEVLPRIGYAVPTEAHPATWACLP